jgi:hypothetical protein
LANRVAHQSKSPTTAGETRALWGVDAVAACVVVNLKAVLNTGPLQMCEHAKPKASVKCHFEHPTVSVISNIPR